MNARELKRELNGWTQVRNWFFLLEQALLVLAGVMLLTLLLVR